MKSSISVPEDVSHHLDEVSVEAAFPVRRDLTRPALLVPPMSGCREAGGVGAAKGAQEGSPDGPPVEGFQVPGEMGLLEKVEESVAHFRELLMSVVVVGALTGTGDLLGSERELHTRVGRECLDPVVGARIVAAHEDPVVLERANAVVDATPNLRPQRASEPVTLTLLGGSSVRVMTPYHLKRPVKRRGPKKGRGRRGKEGNGLYPVLSVLGIQYRVTPALASDVARMVAMSTEAEAQETLRLRGIDLGRKTVSRLAKRFAKRSLEYRDWKQRQTEAGHRGPGTVRGKRLVIGTDGGRLRLREARKRGRPRRSGHRGFDAPWREPKVIIVYEVDKRGRKVPRGMVRYDATMRDADGTFKLLLALLREIGAQEAKEWIFVGDGADWIWDRVPGLIEKMGYDTKKVTQVVDFYHAMERVHAIAAEKKDWTEKDRRRWAARMKKLLRHGQVDEVFSEARQLLRGKRPKRVKSLPGYFKKHRDRMRYDRYRRRGIPLGSGAVESCVRRTINLRMKGNGIFWLAESAEGLLHLRAQLLCGRWDQHVREVLQPEALWSLSSLS